MHPLTTLKLATAFALLATLTVAASQRGKPAGNFESTRTEAISHRVEVTKLPRFLSANNPNRFKPEGFTYSSPPPTAGQYLELRRLAESGDPAGARQLFILLDRCTTAPRRAMMIAPIAEGQEGAPSSTPRSPARDLDALDQTEMELKACENLPSGAIKEAGKWLTRAAEGGDEYSQLLFFSYQHYVVDRSSDVQQAQDQIETFHRDSIRYLKGLAESGSTEAMYSLSAAYDLGTSAPRDPSLAYAFRLAAERIEPVRGAQQVLALMEKGLSPEERLRAEREAHEIIRKLRIK